MQENDFYAKIAKLLGEVEHRKNPYNHHGSKVRQVCFKMVEAMPENPPAHEAELFYYGAELHDIGKIFLDDKLVNYPRRLTNAETAYMQSHAKLGFDLVHKLDYHKIICDIVHYHHENWNGSGYPLGLAGEDIPYYARMVRIADTYDAITSDRVYRRKDTRQNAMMLIKAEAGSAFDPNLVELFEKSMETGR